MPRVEFCRIDLPVRIERLSGGTVRISIGSGTQRVLDTTFLNAAAALGSVLPGIGPEAFDQDPEPPPLSRYESFSSAPIPSTQSELGCARCSARVRNSRSTAPY
jgi:hypothetical protein